MSCISYKISNQWVDIPPEDFFVKYNGKWVLPQKTLVKSNGVWTEICAAALDPVANITQFNPSVIHKNENNQVRTSQFNPSVIHKLEGGSVRTTQFQVSVIKEDASSYTSLADYTFDGTDLDTDIWLPHSKYPSGQIVQNDTIQLDLSGTTEGTAGISFESLGFVDVSATISFELDFKIIQDRNYSSSPLPFHIGFSPTTSARDSAYAIRNIMLGLRIGLPSSLEYTNATLIERETIGGGIVGTPIGTGLVANFSDGFIHRVKAEFDIVNKLAKYWIDFQLIEEDVPISQSIVDALSGDIIWSASCGDYSTTTSGTIVEFDNLTITPVFEQGVVPDPVEPKWILWQTTDNGDLTYTIHNSSSSFMYTDQDLTGKKYMEVSMPVSGIGGSAIMIGVNDDRGGSWLTTISENIYTDNGLFYYNSSQGGTMTGTNCAGINNMLGTVYGVAYDFDNFKMWIRDDTGWLNGDPVAGTGGADYSVGQYDRVLLGNGGISGQFNVNGGQVDFTYSMPDGYDRLMGYRWTPANLTEDPFTWLDANSGDLVLTGNEVDFWPDQGPGGNNANGETVGPDLVENELNNKSIVRFTNDHMVFGDRKVATNVPAIDLYFVYKAVALDASHRPVWLCTNGVSSQAYFRIGPRSSSSGDFTFLCRHGSSPYVLTEDVPDTDWHIWSGVMPFADGTMELRKDGALIDSDTFTPGVSQTETSTDHTLGGNSTFGRATGDMAEFLLFQERLSSDDRDRVEGYLAHKWGLEASLPVDHPYKASPPTTEPPPPAAASYPEAIIADSPVIYWRFDEDVGANTQVDEMGNHNGSRSSGVETGETGLLPSDSSGKSVKFPGTSDEYIEAADGWKGLTGTGDFTIEAWIKVSQPNSVDDYPAILFWGSNHASPPSGSQIAFQLNGVNDATLGALRISVHDGYAVGTKVVNDGELYHVIATMTGANTTGIKFYINGVEDPISSVGDRAIDVTSGANFQVGFARNVYPFRGWIDEVSVYDKALTEQKIVEHYKSVVDSYSSMILADGPVFYWPMDGDSEDVTSNAHHATIDAGAPTFDGPSAIAGEPGSSAVFADGDRLIVAHDSKLNPADNFAYEIWFKTTMTEEGGRLFWRWTPSEQFFISLNDAGAGAIRVFSNMGQSDVSLSANDGNWHHFVFQKNGFDGEVWFDGVKEYTWPGAVALSPFDQPLYIGGDPSGYEIRGNFAHAAYYDKGLSAEEIGNHYNKGIGNSAYRYWKISGIDTTTPSSGYLEISELQLCIGDTFQSDFASATPSAPVDGEIFSYLHDDNTNTRAYWSNTKYPTLEIVYDYGDGNEKAIDGLKWGGYDNSHRGVGECVIEASSDNSTWIPIATLTGMAFPGNKAMTTVYPFT